MKLMHFVSIAATALLFITGFLGLQGRDTKPAVLSLRIGQPFAEVVRESTYPVLNKEFGNPEKDATGFGWTDITKPVIVRFNDPKHGFTLPPTVFVAVTYGSRKVETISTSPMLKKLTFDEAVAVLEDLQNQFKAGGWEPWTENGSEWFDLAPEGRKQLYAKMFQPGWYKATDLRVPNKYSMIFRLWCAAGCATRTPPYLFLIDVGLGQDYFALHDVHGARADKIDDFKDRVRK